MATSDPKLTSFLAYVANYLYVYRIKFNKTPSDNVPLKFLANSTPDTITINCCSAEPVVEVGDYWYNGTLLRKCISADPQVQYGFSKTYKSCYTYADAFSSTLLSLNPEIKLDGVSTTTPAPPTGPVVYVKKSGDTMAGPLFLFRSPVEVNEAVNKGFLDSELAKVNAQASKINVRVSVAESNITNLFAAIEALDPNSTKLNELIDRIVAAENSNAVFTAADQKHTDDIDSLKTRVTALEGDNQAIATRTTLGGVKIGAGLNVEADGTISVAENKAKGTTVSNVQTKLVFGTQNFLPVADNTAVLFKVKIIGRNLTIPTEGCAFTVEGMVLNNGNITFVGSPIKSTVAKSNPLWNADVMIDTANKGLVVAVTGTNGSTIRWSAIVDLTITD